MTNRNLLDAFLALLDVLLGDGKSADALSAELSQRGMPGYETNTALSDAVAKMLGTRHSGASPDGVRHVLRQYVNRPGTSLVLRESGGGESGPGVFTVQSV